MKNYKTVMHFTVFSFAYMKSIQCGVVGVCHNVIHRTIVHMVLHTYNYSLNVYFGNS